MNDKLTLAASEITNEEPISDVIVENENHADAFLFRFPSGRWPAADDVCECGHTYEQHNYSDTLESETDPLGHMYECRWHQEIYRPGLILLYPCQCRAFKSKGD
jgi:hypothetical protein